MIKVDEQAQWWAGEAGNEYTRRNSKVDWRARIPFWHDIMKFTGARSVYEVGCGAGFNLSAIREASPHEVQLYGCDINLGAIQQALAAGLRDVYCGTQRNWLGEYDLSFTAGVLIHVAPENLSAFMKQIVAASACYVLAIEYFADAEEMVEYRGVSDRLWRRPYGKLYEQLGCKILHAGEATGWENAQYWLCEKS